MLLHPTEIDLFGELDAGLEIFDLSTSSFVNMGLESMIIRKGFIKQLGWIRNAVTLGA